MYVKIPISKITKMSIVKTDCKKNLKQLVAEQKCNYAINGGLYDMKTGKVNPIPLRIDGKIQYVVQMELILASFL